MKGGLVLFLVALSSVALSAPGASKYHVHNSSLRHVGKFACQLCVSQLLREGES